MTLARRGINLMAAKVMRASGAPRRHAFLQTGPDRGEGGKYALVPPGYDEESGAAPSTPSPSRTPAVLRSTAPGVIGCTFHPTWIQTVAGKSWFTIFRLYGPLGAWFDKTWRLPEIERITR